MNTQLVKAAALRPLLFVVALAASGGAACADDHHPQDALLVGGNGGSDFREQCPQDWALAGVHVTLGVDVNSISPVCSPALPGTGDDETRQLGTYGYAKNRPGTASCLPDFVQGMEVSSSPVNIVHDLKLVCAGADGGTHTASIMTADGTQPLTPGGTAQGTGRTECPAGEIAVGLYGRHGSSVDALGLVCGTVSAPPQTDLDQ